MPRTTGLTAPTYGVAALAFAATAGGLAVQVRSGADPALGAPVAESTIPQPRYVITRREERVRVVVRRVRDLPSLAPRPVAVAAAPAGGGSSVAAPIAAAPVAAAPVAAAPARAAAPAPAAPAPAAAAPVPAPVTRAS